MTGKEVEMYFGDHSLLLLEDQHKRYADQLTELSAQLVTANESEEPDAEEIERLENELQETRENMRNHDRIVRRAAQEFGNKRGPVTLH